MFWEIQIPQLKLRIQEGFSDTYDLADCITYETGERVVLKKKMRKLDQTAVKREIRVLLLLRWLLLYPVFAILLGIIVPPELGTWFSCSARNEFLTAALDKTRRKQ